MAWLPARRHGTKHATFPAGLSVMPRFEPFAVESSLVSLLLTAATTNNACCLIDDYVRPP